jgi:hypothetical protein
MKKVVLTFDERSLVDMSEDIKNNPSKYREVVLLNPETKERRTLTIPLQQPNSITGCCK